ncbi:hypothetical protein ACCI51_13170 [Microbulbifer echini]|uniref:Uncharacterized protein n=1 Tax=Microbulbifer echini TaxID=1529067 RepID=A0ABV4NPP1_9GAMM
MFFSEEFIRSVEENPIVGIVEACNMGNQRLRELESHDGWNESEHELLWEVASFLELVIETNQLYIDIVFPEATGEIDTNCKNLSSYVNMVKEHFEGHSIKLKIDSYKGRYQTAFKAAFAYEFSQGDFDRIQSLINEIRDHIVANNHLEQDHKQRLLRRLENLQGELHKRVSDLDRFWGMVGDAGVVLGKLGKDAKPIVDRVKEVAEIVWKTQARTEELPSNSPNPMIGHNENT